MATIQVSELRQIALLAVEIAEGYAAAGVHEEGGNNRGDQVEFFQHLTGGGPGDPWCGDFESTCGVKAFCRFHKLPEDRLHLLQYAGAARHVWPVSGYCPAILAIAKARKQFVPKGGIPLRGDLVLFDLEDEGEPHHVEFVRATRFLNGVRVIDTVGGNTKSGISGPQGDGDGVFLRTRGIDKVFGYVRLG